MVGDAVGTAVLTMGIGVGVVIASGLLVGTVEGNISLKETLSIQTTPLVSARLNLSEVSGTFSVAV
jgi:hypothetical protein